MDERGLEQRRSALVSANAVRRHRREIKEAIGEGRRTLADVLASASADRMLDSMKVYDLVRVVPGVGSVRGKRWLRDAGLHPTSTVGGSSSRQLSLLALLDGSYRSRSRQYRIVSRRRRTIGSRSWNTTR